MKIFEVHLLRLLSVYEVRYPIVKHILFEVFGVSTIDYQDELRNSMTIVVEGEDFLEYILQHESDFTNFSNSKNAIDSSKHFADKVIALFLTILIIQKYNNDFDDIQHYLNNYKHLYIPDHMLDDEEERSTSKDDSNATILQGIAYNIEYHASTFDENGLNNTLIDLYTRPSYPKDNKIIDTLILNKQYKEEIERRCKYAFKNKFFDEAAQREWKYENSGCIYTEVKEKYESGGEFKTRNEELLQDVYFDTYKYAFQKVRSTFKSKDISTEIFDDYYSNEDDWEYILDTLFDSTKIFTQMKINNHPMAFLLTCSLTEVSATKMIFQELSDAIFTGKTFRFLVDASSTSIGDVENFIRMKKGLNLLGIDTAYLDGLIYILEQKSSSYYIEYVVLAKFLGLTFKELKKASERLLIHDAYELRGATFNNFEKHTFNAIAAYENLHLYENIQSSISESLYPLTHIHQ